ncbi:MAG: zf-HC2 domain-containing protein [Acidobacteria bacterium]|nr:zf-HC2 domain-containing protein [Acidobacteriota bacterium]
MAGRSFLESLREMKTCHEMGKWLQNYLDGEIDSATADQVRDHLVTCVKCGMEFETYRRIVESLDERPSTPAVISDDVAVARLRRFAENLTMGNPLDEDEQ